MSATLTATAGGYYRVYVDGQEHSQHQQEREAVEAALAVLKENPGAAVEYDHDYRVRVEAPGAVEPEPGDPPVEEPEEPEPEPPAEPEDPNDPEIPDGWFSGLYALSLDGLPGTLDIDAGTVTLPVFGRVAAAIDELGGKIIATFEVPGHGEGTIELTYRDGALSGHATTAGQRVPVTGQREAEAPEPEPQEPLPDLPPPTGEGNRPNEPQGFVALADRAFETLDAPGWKRDVARNGAARFEIAEIGGRRVGAMTFPTGHTGGGSSSSTPRVGVHVGTPRRLYLSFGLMVSENWYGHTGASMSKIFYVGHPLMVMLAGSANNRLTLRLSLQGGEAFNCRWDGAENEVRATLEDAEIERGRWHQIEVLAEMNAPGQPTGRLHAWVDGRKALQYSNRRILGTGELYRQIGSLDWHPIYGGQNGRDVPETQHQYIDRIYVSAEH